MSLIGINVLEVDGLGSPVLAAAPTSVTGFNILTRRGTPSQAVMIDSFARFVERFGSYFPGGLGAYLVKGYFDNGGQIAYVNRVVSDDPATGHVASRLDLQDGAPLATLRVLAGFRGGEDPGSWGDQLQVRVTRTNPVATRLREAAAASVTGGVALAAPVDMSALPSITLRVDGEAADRVITFQAADFPGGAAAATPEQIRDAINGRQSAVVASLDGGNNLVLTSTGEVALVGDGWTSVEMRAANATLGLVVAAPVFGTATATATTGATLRRVDDFDLGDAIEVYEDGAPANTASVKLMSRNPLTGAVSWSPAIAGIAGWTQRSIRVRALRFTLTVAEGGTEPENVRETHADLSMEADTSNYAPARINDPVQGSRWITVEDLANASAVGVDIPAALAWTPLAGGRDGTPTSGQFVGDEAARTGLHAFDTQDIQLLTCERTDASIVVAALAYCANRNDCLYVGAVPEALTETAQAIAYGQSLQGKKVYGALYGPWITIADPAGVGDNPRRNIPPVGHVLGMMGRIERTRGIWKAPAGDEASLAGVLDVTYRLTDAEHDALAKQGAINGVRAIPRAGIVVDASRTLSTDPRWMYVGVRLLFNFVKSSLKNGLRWVRQEPNRDALWNAIKFNAVTPFLLGLWRRGAFGTGKPEEVFTVICDASNNPPDQVDQGILTVEVYFYPSKPAETIQIIVGQQPSGATASEA
jgi:phage tail sheath protein FI